MELDPIAAICFLFIVWVIAESYASEGDSKKKSSSGEGDFVDLIFSLLVSPIMLVVGALLLLGGGLLLLFPLFLGMLSLIGVAMKSLFSVVRAVLRKTWSLAKAMVRGMRRLWRISVGSGRIIRAVLGFPLRVVKGLFRLVRSVVRSVRSVVRAFLKTVRGLWKTTSASCRLFRGVVRVLHGVIRTFLRIVGQTFKFLSSIVRSLWSLLIKVLRAVVMLCRKAIAPVVRLVRWVIVRIAKLAVRFARLLWRIPVIRTLWSLLRKVLRVTVMLCRKAVSPIIRLVRWMVVRIAKLAIRSAGQVQRVTVETKVVRTVSRQESASSRPGRSFLSQESVVDRHAARVRKEHSEEVSPLSRTTERSPSLERVHAAHRQTASPQHARPIAASRHVNEGVRTRWGARQEGGTTKNHTIAGAKSVEEGEDWNEQPEIMGTLRTIGWSTRHKIYPRRK